MDSVSVVIPVFNEQDNVSPLAEELSALSSRWADYEVIFVDDGSSDATWLRIEACSKAFPFVRGVRCSVNSGQSAAMLLGLAHAKGDILVTMDGDAQNNPADIPELVARIGEFDVVCGYRHKRKDSWSRRGASRLANVIRTRVTHDQIKDTGCSLKAFKRDCVADLPHVEGVHRFMPAYFALNGRSIAEIPVDHRARTRGVSKYTNMKRLPRTTYDLFGFMWYRKRYIQLSRLDTK